MTMLNVSVREISSVKPEQSCILKPAGHKLRSMVPGIFFIKKNLRKVGFDGFRDGDGLSNDNQKNTKRFYYFKMQVVMYFNLN